jgi:hypothetical protein
VRCATCVAQQTRADDDAEPAGTNYSIGHVGLHAMPFNGDLVNHHFHNVVIESLDVHVDPPSLFRAQLAVRQGRHAPVLVQASASSDTSAEGDVVGQLAFARL